jgi:hypothetical protein
MNLNLNKLLNLTTNKEEFLHSILFNIILWKKLDNGKYYIQQATFSNESIARKATTMYKD